jgi:hypothetical protein
MNCPTCGKQMKPIRKIITNNLESQEKLIEYNSITYNCKLNDTWVTTEIPVK